MYSKALVPVINDFNSTMSVSTGLLKLAKKQKLCDPRQIHV